MIVEEFTVPPTLDGLTRLRERLAARDVRLAVAEPTSMTWLGLSIALREAGIDLARRRDPLPRLAATAA